MARDGEHVADRRQPGGLVHALAIVHIDVRLAQSRWAVGGGRWAVGRHGVLAPGWRTGTPVALLILTTPASYARHEPPAFSPAPPLDGYDLRSTVMVVALLPSQSAVV